MILDRMAVQPARRRAGDRPRRPAGRCSASADARVRRPQRRASTPSTSCRRPATRRTFGLGDLAPVDRPRRQPPRQRSTSSRGARALALIRGRTYATPQDVFDIAPEVLRHRLLLTYDALARDITPDDVVNRMLATVPATWVSPKPNDAARHAEPMTATAAEPLVSSPTASSGRPGRRPRQVAELVRTLELTITRRARRRRCTATTRASRRATAASPASRACTSRATTSAASTGTSPPAPSRPTSATRSPTATSRPGWSSTSRRRCASARRRPRRRRSALAAAACRRLPHRPQPEPPRRGARRRPASSR